MSLMRPSWSWAESPSEAEEFQAEASGLVGQTIARVRYVNIDYLAEQFRGGAIGPRTIESEVEWEHPTWSYPACDTVDFGVEIETVAGRHFTASWESPGPHEGLGLRPLTLLGAAVDERADCAVWDVTWRSGWRSFVHKVVERVTLHYGPWGDGSAALWCSWITLEVDSRPIEFLLADASRADEAEVAPSADNVAVLFAPDRLPSWLVSRLA
jgi:hypothetical protein